MRGSTNLERKLNKHATTILIGGIFLSFSVLMYLTFCNMPCEDATYGVLHEELREAQNQAFWDGHILAPAKSFSAKVVFLVISAPGNLQKRDTIRDTWGKQLPKSAMIKFAIGSEALEEKTREEVKREETIHKDLLMLNHVIDSYQNLTLKLLESFRWINRNINFQFLVKADEDTFVNMENFLLQLSSKPKERLYWGFFDGRAHVKKHGKWSEKDWILCDRYLPYALGGGYVLSSDLVHYVAANYKYLKRFNNEDVSLGAWLGPLDLIRIHDPQFDTEYKSRGCSNSYIVTHKQTNLQMRELYNNIIRTGHLCTKEFQVRKSYNYNWDVLPSNCCSRDDSAVP